MPYYYKSIDYDILFDFILFLWSNIGKIQTSIKNSIQIVGILTFRKSSYSPNDFFMND